jgi:N-acetylglutamate synthase-like GNAT family acetyltransferase
MPPGLRIRLATEDDAVAIGVLVRRATRQDVLPDQSGRAAAHLLAGMTARAERQRIREGKRYFVAEIGGRIVGVVATRDDRHVFRLFVSRRWRRRGIAGALFRRIAADCRRRSGTRMFTLNASKFAVEAYLRLGFRVVGRAVAKGPGRVVTTPMRLRLAARPKGSGRRGSA